MSAVDDVKARLDIVDVVGGYVPAAEGRTLLQGALPLPHGEDALLRRLPGPPELALLRRLRHRRRRHRLRLAQGEPRLQPAPCACWPTAPASSCATTARAARRSRPCRTPTRRRRSTSTACCRTPRPRAAIYRGARPRPPGRQRLPASATRRRAGTACATT